MLKVENISTGYGKKQVLFDVSFEVKKGDIVLIAGSNGSGKSTLLKAIYGVLPLWGISKGVNQNGSIIFGGERITGKQTSELLKRGLLYIPQKNNLFEEMSVKENMEMAGLTISDKKILKQRMENALSIFRSLEPLFKRTPMKLSGGERKMLTLAMATLHQPKMFLVDEPFSGLSSQNINIIIENLKYINLNSGTTLLIVEHRVKECSQIANRIIGLKIGEIYKDIVVNKNFDINELHSLFI